MRNPPAGYKTAHPFNRSGNNRHLVKRRRYEEGGEVEDDDNYDKGGRAGNLEYGVTEQGEFTGRRDPYPKQQEISPPETKDQNVVLPRGILDDYFDKPPRPKKA